MTTNTINLPNYKDIYHILIRDSNISFKTTIHFNAELDDHKAICEWAKNEFPEDYKEALAIASNPNRQTVTLWKDELDWYTDKKEFIEWERDGLNTLIYEFVMDHGLKDKFHSYLQEKIKEGADCYGDLEFLSQDYK